MAQPKASTRKPATPRSGKAANKAAASTPSASEAVADASKTVAKAVAEAGPDAEHDNIRAALLALRERLTGTVSQLRAESLTRDDEVNPEEDGSDAFERLFSLERANTDHHVIQQIDEALRALDEGTYGQCEMCGCAIEAPRLKALPFAKTCVSCQSEMERMRGGFPQKSRMTR